MIVLATSAKAYPYHFSAVCETGQTLYYYILPNDNQEVKVTYLRNKKERTAMLTLKNEQGTTKVVKNADVDVLGIDVRPITDSQKKQLEINYGLEVLKVSGGKMKEAGVPKGFIIQMVNDQPMRSFDDLQEAVKDAKDQMLVIKGIFPTGKRGGFVVYLQNE